MNRMFTIIAILATLLFEGCSTMGYSTYNNNSKDGVDSIYATGPAATVAASMHNSSNALGTGHVGGITAPLSGNTGFPEYNGGYGYGYGYNGIGYRPIELYPGYNVNNSIGVVGGRNRIDIVPIGGYHPIPPPIIKRPPPPKVHYRSSIKRRCIRWK